MNTNPKQIGQLIITKQTPPSEETNLRSPRSPSLEIAALLVLTPEVALPGFEHEGGTQGWLAVQMQQEERVWGIPGARERVGMASQTSGGRSWPLEIREGGLRSVGSVLPLHLSGTLTLSLPLCPHAPTPCLSLRLFSHVCCPRGPWPGFLQGVG